MSCETVYQCLHKHNIIRPLQLGCTKLNYLAVTRVWASARKYSGDPMFYAKFQQCDA